MLPKGWQGQEWSPSQAVPSPVLCRTWAEPGLGMGTGMIPSLDIFKSHLDLVLGSQLQLALTEGWTR